jgi:hypothetical protein
MRRPEAGGDDLWIVALLKGDGELRVETATTRPEGDVELLLSTEDTRFTAEAMPPVLTSTDDCLTVQFARPGAVVLRAAGRGGRPS